MVELLLILISTVFVNNMVLTRFLGVCPFMGVSKRVETALGMGLAVVVVMTISALVTWLFNYHVLIPLKIEYLQTIAFILIIASLVQMVEIILHKTSPTLYQSLGIYLPLITTNCAVLGVTVLNIQKNYTLIEASVFACGAGLGFTLAMWLFAGLRERLEFSPIPKCFQGTAIALITAGLLSLAFMGFSGLVKN
ncbi:MAG: electron transport complex subunit RsxA [Desulfuromonas sp.]|nr:electron transport complex subunit RsxA [Desulfuromonas sp.]